jgi:UDP-N-acetyl-D-mannosaminuronic acid dehydrogenase
MATNIVVIGMGYVGIPMAALLADVDDFYVIGIQRRSKRSGWKIDCLNVGKNPFEGEEPGLDELIAKVVKNGKFKVTDDYSACKEADYILIDVQTPVDENKIPRYESLRNVSENVSKNLSKGTTIIIESTVAPGTTDYMVAPILEEGSGLKRGEDFFLVFSFERLMPGALIDYIVNMPRVIGGGCEEANKRALALYSKVIKKELEVTDTLSAELTKVIENTYRDVNIAFSNEMALLCEDFNRNIFEIINLINMRHDRMMHIPGAGVGGHCLTKDPWLLMYGQEKYTEKKHSSKIVPASRYANDFMPLHTAELLNEAIHEAQIAEKNLKIAIFGVAYKGDCDDTRNTPAVFIIDHINNLLSDNKLEVIAHDPYVKPIDYEKTDLTRDIDFAITNTDAIVIATNHSAYKSLDLASIKQKMRTPIIIDGRNMLDKEICQKLGFIYKKVGEGSK